MLNVNLDVLNASIAETRATLGDGFIGCDFIDTNGLPITGWNSSPAGSALMRQVTTEIQGALSNSSMPKIKNYYIVDLKDSKMIVMINHANELLEGWLLDSSKINPGIMIGMAIPKSISNNKTALDA